MPHISSVVSQANSGCEIRQEDKEGTSRTYLLTVSTVQPAKAVFLIGFIRQREPADTAAVIVAQALATSYNPPNGWGNRLIWIAVVDPFNSQWIMYKCYEQVAGAAPVMEKYGTYSADPATDIIDSMHACLLQNIHTYG